MDKKTNAFQSLGRSGILGPLADKQERRGCLLLDDGMQHPTEFHAAVAMASSKGCQGHCSSLPLKPAKGIELFAL